MNKLIKDCYEFMKDADFSYAICGGYALELFLNKKIRIHSDIDITVFKEDTLKAIKYIKSKSWDMYELIGEGLVHIINDNKDTIDICAFCLKQKCSLVKMNKKDDDTYGLEIKSSEQHQFDFLEIIFNKQKDSKFILNENINITRDMDKAILFYENIPYLSPEVILFLKSNNAYSMREDYNIDFNMVSPHLPNENKLWLINALEKAYPNGHIWIGKLKST